MIKNNNLLESVDRIIEISADFLKFQQINSFKNFRLDYESCFNF